MSNNYYCYQNVWSGKRQYKLWICSMLLMKYQKLFAELWLAVIQFLVGDENCSWDIKKQKENRMSVIIWSKDKVLSSDL